MPSSTLPLYPLTRLRQSLENYMATEFLLCKYYLYIKLEHENSEILASRLEEA